MIAHAHIPPPPIIVAVARETRRSGWPHEITQAEAAAVTRAAFRAQHLRSGSGYCRFGATVARVTCTFTPTGRPTYVVKVRVRQTGAWSWLRVAS